MNDERIEPMASLPTDQTASPDSIPPKDQQSGFEDAKESEAQRNFAELRKQHHRALSEKEELRQRLAQYESTSQVQQVPEESDELSIGDEDITEGKHLKQVMRKLKKQEAELQALKQRTSEELVDTKIKNRFPDYDSVVNVDTLRTLAEEDPELAYTIQSSPDVYNKAILAYKEIKKRGISPNTLFDSDKRRAIENASKPRPLASVSPQQGSSPLSHANAFANGLTPDLQKQLWKEMNDAMKKG